MNALESATAATDLVSSCRSTAVTDRPFWPFEDIPRDSALDGSHRSRLPALHIREPWHLPDDIAAAKIWLWTHSEKALTYRVYRSAMDALFNWAILRRGKAVSALTPADFAEFDRYLANPTLWDPPVSPGRFPRGDIRWRPVVGPRGASSRVTTMSAIRSFANWMSLHGYANVRVEASEWDLARGSPSYSSRLAKGVGVLRPSIDIEAWTAIKLSMPCWPTTQPWLRRRAVVGLLYYGALTVSEVLSVDYQAMLASLQRDRHARIDITGRPPRRSTVYLVPPLIEMLESWLRSSSGLPERPRRDCAIGTRGRVQDDVRQGMARAATFAERQGWLQMASLLAKVSCLGFRYAMARHHRDKNAAWHLLGAASGC